MSNARLLSQDCASAHVAHCIGLFIGRGRLYSVSDVSAATGISARTISSWVAGAPEDRRCPSGDALLVLCGFLGRPFVARLISPVGMGAIDLEHGDRLEPTHPLSSLLGLVAQMARYAEDNIIDHREDAPVRDVMDQVIAICLPYSNYRDLVQ